ncbi:hypothetical protein BCV72DRAFT_8258 [Rhizopus microsporus var. microsporus]|uniref:Uncharacterized protein n=1 Tax=Rhizopus microsporus var. microsporus TaxID=86635 RepID=A0A1X0QYH8_RHIZD|nr:hypothetical protein BCV72DRAFT_8258 [Rhizopus microsporus var. microsporus]
MHYIKRFSSLSKIISYGLTEGIFNLNNAYSKPLKTTNNKTSVANDHTYDLLVHIHTFFSFCCVTIGICPSLSSVVYVVIVVSVDKRKRNRKPALLFM